MSEHGAAPGPELYAEVSRVEGTFRWDGIMFEVEAAEDIIITSLDFFTWIPANYTVQVKTRDAPSEQWTTMCDTRVQGLGKSMATRISPKVFTEVEISTGSSKTLYVTLNSPELVMDLTPSAVSSYAFSNPDMKIGPGSAVTYSTGKTYPGYTWKGRIRYKLKSTANIDRPACEDKPGDVFIDALVGEKPCRWLAENMFHYQHVCAYVNQSTHCPHTCGVCYIILP